MATRAQQWYEGLLNDYRSKYLRVADQVIRTGEASDRTWDRFENSTEEVLKAADLIAAAKIQWKTKRQRIIVPDKKNVTIDDIIKHNPWYAEHAKKTHRGIKQASKSIRRIEKRYYTSHAEHLQARPQTQIPQSRLTLFSRNAIGDVAETSQQVVLSDPEIGFKLPYAQYFTRDDKKVRPNHFWMYGFVAVRSWDGWKVIRPLTGWNCFPGNTVVSGDFSTGFKAWYDGKMVEITTAKGHRLSVTANHPILTNKGWVSADSLNHGHKLIADRIGINGPLSRHESDNNGPALAKDVFNTIRVNGIAPIHSPFSPLDFDGDASRFIGKVDVVSTNGMLGSERYTEAGHPISDGNFIGANFVTEIDGNCFGPLDTFGQRPLASASRFPSRPALACDTSLGLLDRLPLERFSFGPAAEWDIIFPKHLHYGHSGYTKFLRQLIGAFSDQISFDHISSIKHSHYSNYVYDFESNTGAIVANGICISNCRCFTIFRSLGYAIEQGWAYKNGRPKWEAKWPNAQSKRNYERKVFPDPGWRGPKPWA